jgi:hypothetical protein
VTDSGGLSDSADLSVATINQDEPDQVFERFLNVARFPAFDTPFPFQPGASGWLFHLKEKAEIIEALQQLYDSSKTAAGIFRQIADLNQPFDIMRGVTTDYVVPTFGSPSYVRVNTDDATKLWLMKDGSTDSLSLGTIVLHELVHVLEDFSDPNSNAFPPVEQLRFQQTGMCQRL